MINRVSISRKKSISVIATIVMISLILSSCQEKITDEISAPQSENSNVSEEISETGGSLMNDPTDQPTLSSSEFTSSEPQSSASWVSSVSSSAMTSSSATSQASSSTVSSPAPIPTGPAQVGDPNFVPGSLYKGPVIAFREPGESVTLGVWWWVLRGITEPVNGVSVDMILDMLIANNVSEIYLDVSKMVPLEEEIAQGGLSKDDLAGGLVSERYVRGFIKKCSKYGIRVAALTGAAGDAVLRWLDPSKNYYYIKSFVEKIAVYNHTAASDERFYSVHLDVEPHTMSNWEKNRSRYTQWLADFAVVARKECDKYGLELEYDVYSWFREDDIVKDPDGNDVNIIDLMTSQCHALGIMSYYNTAAGQYDRATNTELAYAKKNNCRLIAGTETIQISPSSITYFYSGKNKLVAEQAKLRALFDASGYDKFGGAIHHVYSLYALMTK